ncbi:MAG TPA: hypothetical protein VKA08_00560 [Balneolales bacterium]|nr:hypothetical protein [Balneolales bacterium]
MDILKLIFEHDMLLEKLSGELDSRNERKRSSTLEEFMKPAPTYSRFYITGTKLDGPLFGLDQIDHAGAALKAAAQGLKGLQFTTAAGHQHDDLLPALEELPVGEAVLAHSGGISSGVDELTVSDNEQLRDRISAILKFLDAGQHVIYKERALNGFDLHIFSRRNLYEVLFYPLKSLIAPDLRFFSINGKRVTGERFFYFETHRLDRPPHGFTEVYPETVV